MRAGWYTDAYFNHARATLLATAATHVSSCRSSRRTTRGSAGMDEAIAILKLCSRRAGRADVTALYDGDRIEPWEPVLTIEGDYTHFAHLETVYLGRCARRTLITTNVVRVLEAANGKPIIFMPAAHDHHRVQTGDGYAAYVAGQVTGARSASRRDEQASWWGGAASALCRTRSSLRTGGDTVARGTKFAEWAPPEMSVTVLVDFANDSVRTALDVAEALGERLWGIPARHGRDARRPVALGRDGRTSSRRA
jgi:nicotinate phosphoribosyltransferase